MLSKGTRSALLETEYTAAARWAEECLNSLFVDGKELRRCLNGESVSATSSVAARTVSRWLYEDVHLKRTGSSVAQGAEVASPVVASTALRNARRTSLGWSLRPSAEGATVATSALSGVELLIAAEQRSEWIVGPDALSVPRVRKGFLSGWDSITGLDGNPLSPDLRMYIPWVNSSHSAENLIDKLDQAVSRWMIKFANFATQRPDKTVLYCSTGDACKIFEALQQAAPSTQSIELNGPGFALIGPYGIPYGLNRAGVTSSFGVTVARQAGEYLVESYPTWRHPELCAILQESATAIGIDNWNEALF